MSIDKIRDTAGKSLANLALRVATSRYREFIYGSIKYGMDSAVEDEIEGRPSPPDWRSLT